MPAMHSDVFIEMMQQLEVKRDIMISLIPFKMSHEECLKLVAPSDHINILTSAAKYADISASEAWMELYIPGKLDGETGVRVMLMMRTHAQKEPPLRPRNPDWQVGASGDAVIAWVTKRLEIGRRFGAAHYVLNELNERCDIGTQLRYMLPAVMHLCKPGQNPRMDRWADKFAAYKPCKFAPTVSPELKNAIQDTSALLTSCALIGDGVPERLLGEVDISVGWNLPSFKIEGRHWARK